jgi:hypothetical protein
MIILWKHMGRKLESYILKFSSYRTFLWSSWMCSGVHKFSKYLWATTKDQVPEEWCEASSMLRIQNSGISVHIVVCEEKKNSVLVFKVLSETIDKI